MRLIDADALKNADFQDFSNTDVMAAIDAAPTIDAEPVRRGRWVNKNDMAFGYGAISGKCSVCGKYSGAWLINDRYNYCPYCGAKMDI